MNNVYAFIITRATTPERSKLLSNTIDSIEAQGCNVHLYHNEEHNRGQHVCFNKAIDTASKGNYKYLLRVDDDCEFLTKRWLRKLITASEVLDDAMILSPVVKGLKHPPERSEPCMVKGIELEFLVEAIGGICRLHPLHLLKSKPYISDVRKPMGSGDATGIGAWCQRHIIPMAYVRSIKVRHATARQERLDPKHFINHEVFQHIPYIPPFTAT